MATYFNDAYRFCELLVNLLRPEAVAVIVLGNSIIQGIEVKTDQFFGEIAQLSGLEFQSTHRRRSHFLSQRVSWAGLELLDQLGNEGLIKFKEESMLVTHGSFSRKMVPHSVRRQTHLAS